MRAAIFARALLSAKWQPVLEDLGFETDIYPSFRQGEKSLVEKSYDLVVVESSVMIRTGGLGSIPEESVMSFPAAGGLAVVKTMRANGANSGTPVIYSSPLRREHLGKIVREFRKYDSTYFFYEINEEKFPPIIEQVMQLSRRAANN